MLKYIHKITSYLNESRIYFNLSKRKRNLRFKNKVLYLKDQTVLWKNNRKNRYWYKYLYVINNEYIYDNKKSHFVLKKNILHRNFDKPAVIHSNGTKFWFLNGVLH